MEVRLAPWDKERALALLRGRAKTIVDGGDALLLLDVDGRLPDLGSDLEHSTVIHRPPNLEDVFLLLTGEGLGSE